MKAALVLSGGGALGAAHIGVLKALEQKGYEFDFYAGVSAGAIISAISACGKSPTEIGQMLDEVNFFSLAFDFRKALFSLIRGDKIKAFLDRVFEGRSFADVSPKLLIGATDFSTGERVMISKGLIADAVRASISVPVLFEPFYHEAEERWLVDGGLSQNLPLDVAMEQYDGERIFAVDVATSFDREATFEGSKGKSKARNLFDTAQRMTHIMLLSQQQYFANDSRVIPLNPHLEEFSAVDVLRLDDIAKRGEMAANSDFS